MPRKALWPMAEPVHEGTACTARAGLVLLVLTCIVRVKIDPSGRVKLKG